MRVQRGLSPEQVAGLGLLGVVVAIGLNLAVLAGAVWVVIAVLQATGVIG